MKKKRVPEPIISPEILDLVKRSAEPDRLQPGGRCTVCGNSTIPLTGPHTADDDDLCWVCRRLKISAWRETDQQATVQE